MRGAEGAGQGLPMLMFNFSTFTNSRYTGDMTSSVLRQPFPPGASPSETELQKMLVDERTKCELHRGNYETLKAEHTGLQDDFIQVQEEARHLQAQLDRLQLQLAERTREIVEKNTEMEELRLQVMTPQRLELLRAQVQQEMEGPVRARFARLEEEAEKYRSEYNKLRYGYTVLNAQFEHQKEEHARVAEEQRLRYEAEIAHLDKDKENLSAQYQNADPRRDRKQTELLLREKTQLASRLKGLQAEAAELQAQKEHSEQRADNVQRVQNRQMAEAQAALKSLEAERQSLRLRLERTESELGLSHEQSNGLAGQLHKTEKRVDVLTGQIESLKHSHKMEVASVKLECTRSKGELERERDTLKGQLEGLQTDAEVLKHVAERQKEVVVEKEREVARKVQSARDEEIYKSAVLQEEKLELEHRLAALEQQRALQDTQAQAQKEEWEEQLGTAQRGETSARNELQSLRLRLKQQSAQLEELERQTVEVSSLKQKTQELRAQLSTSSRSEAELAEANQRLRAKADGAREELRAARSQAERSQREAERRAEESQIERLEEKHKLRERETKSDEKYSQLKDKMKRAAVAQKKRRNQTDNKEKSLQSKIQLLKAQMEELKLEAAAANKSASHPRVLRRKLRELQRRHGEFRRLLLGDQGAFGFGPALLTPARNPILARDAASNVPEEEEHREMVLLCERLDELERAQQQQLEELNSLGEHIHISGTHRSRGQPKRPGSISGYQCRAQGRHGRESGGWSRGGLEPGSPTAAGDDLNRGATAFFLGRGLRSAQSNFWGSSMSARMSACLSASETAPST
ncbi:centrosomal protein of 83 kDa-like isoform X2 [Phycodurus eques]|uniref:centrosomal protein of 83 kDa-like isoform X2 n=1 Tax=Phycodurus eques TaxID=693459 RepID=UPI002ACD7F8C|nr:centrosomal protein of 83 kDa-like isoform X2 [Phycodurus eques]